jgi:hypothetical protein
LGEESNGAKGKEKVKEATTGKKSGSSQAEVPAEPNPKMKKGKSLNQKRRND